jgi:uncharacterized membrane protein YcjF (UPF0283 family)
VAVLGLILLAAAGVLTAAVVTSNTNSLSVDLWGATISDLSVAVVFVAGMITTVLAVVGLGLVMGALRRGRRLRQERRSLRQENKQLSRRVEEVDSPTDRPYEPAPARQETAPASADASDEHQTRHFIPRGEQSDQDRTTTTPS